MCQTEQKQRKPKDRKQILRLFFLLSVQNEEYVKYCKRIYFQKNVGCFDDSHTPFTKQLHLLQLKRILSHKIKLTQRRYIHRKYNQIKWKPVEIRDELDHFIFPFPSQRSVPNHPAGRCYQDVFNSPINYSCIYTMCVVWYQKSHIVKKKKKSLVVNWD